MEKKSFLIHFIILAILIFALGYFGGTVIENKRLENLKSALVAESKELGGSIQTMLTNEKLSDKETAIQFVLQNFLEDEPFFLFYQIKNQKNGILTPFLSGKRNNHIMPISLNKFDDPKKEGQEEAMIKNNYLIFTQDITLGQNNSAQLLMGFDYQAILRQNKNTSYIPIFSVLTVLLVLSFGIFLKYKQKHKRLEKILSLSNEDISKEISQNILNNLKEKEHSLFSSTVSEKVKNVS